jgi:hypothetical protein
MRLDINNFDLEMIRIDYDEMNGLFSELLGACESDDKKERLLKIYEETLGNYIQSIFNTPKDVFLSEAYDELSGLMGYDDENPLYMTPLTIFQMKLGHLVGTKNPDIISIYNGQFGKN